MNGKSSSQAGGRFKRKVDEVKSSILENFNNFKQLLSPKDQSEQERVKIEQVTLDALSSFHLMKKEHQLLTGSTMTHPSNEQLQELATAL